MNDLKISVVTAVYNGEKWIEQCMQSIMNQTYRNFEHIVMDGGSTDGTVEIVRRYEKLYNVKVYSKKDNGMYDAIANGFDLATGDIFCWLNSDDKFFPWAFEVMNRVMAQTGVEWCIGFPTWWGDSGVNSCLFRMNAFSRTAIKAGLHDGRVLPCIQQESTFWSRSLWERSNGSFIREYKMAGDYQLWKRFSEFTPLYKVNSAISGFTKRVGQKSEDKESYFAEVGELTLWKRFLIFTRAARLIDALLSLIYKKDRIVIQRLYPSKKRTQSAENM